MENKYAVKYVFFLKKNKQLGHVKEKEKEMWHEIKLLRESYTHFKESIKQTDWLEIHNYGNLNCWKSRTKAILGIFRSLNAQ